ncbi:MAG: Wzz/FepE/Etk N-terminal domain-containing protein [Cellulosilyticaceae bacterium]
MDKIIEKPIEEQISQLATHPKVQLIISQEETQEDEVSLGELFGVIWEGKKMIVMITLLAFLIGIGYAGVDAFIIKKDVGKVDTVVSFKFEGIEEGLNPNGDVFNIQEMTNKSILEKAIASTGVAKYGISSELLRENIQIQGVVPVDVQNRMNLINKMAEKDITQLEKISNITYYPEQYKVTLNITKDMGIKGEQAEQVLAAIVNEYKNYFMSTYSDKELLSTAITTLDQTRYDYSEYMLMVDNVLKDVSDFIEEHEELAPTYRAKATGLTFAELSEQVDMLRNIEVNNTQAIINTFVLTKNKDRLISVYENNIKRLEMELEQKINLANSIRRAANEYKKDKLVVMGKEDGLGNVEVPTSSEVYDELISEALNTEQEVSKIRYNIAYHKDLLVRLTESVDENVVNVAPYITQVEESIDYIQEQVSNLVVQVNTAVSEYYETEAFKNSVKRDMPALYQSFTKNYIKGSVLAVVIATLLGGVISVIYVLIAGMTSANKAKKTQGGNHEA